MSKSICKFLLASVAAIVASPGLAAEVTADRLTNADKEPHNWLMNHRTYDAQRYSPLDKINKANIKIRLPKVNATLLRARGRAD